MGNETRRKFLQSCAFAAPGVLLSDRLLAAIPAVGGRALTFYHTHTGERLTAEYFSAGAYLPDALAAINRHLRDFRTGEEHVIDPALLDLLHRLNGLTGSHKPFQVISGFRSPKTNQELRGKSHGVAAGSLHMVGKAIDIRVADVPLPKLQTAALSLHAGGVGYYPLSNFVHVDTGRVRKW